MLLSSFAICCLAIAVKDYPGKLVIDALILTTTKSNLPHINSSFVIKIVPQS